MISLLSLAAASVLVGLYAVYRRRDRRLLRNGLFLVGAVWFAFTGLLGLLTELVPPLQWVTIALLALLPLAVLVLAAFLVANGFRMIRAEGRSLANLLSLLAGLALVALPVLAAALLWSGTAIGAGTAILLGLVCSYLGVVFVAFLCYSVVYGRSRPQARPAALVVLGSKIIDGRVPPLLRSRLDKALEIYRACVAGGCAPLLIPSGGKETTRPAPRERPWPTTFSHTERIRATWLPRPRLGTPARTSSSPSSQVVQSEAGRAGPVVAVTNNYHVLRAAVLARQIGDAEVVGAPTAPYYLPSAFLREYVAIVLEHKRLHIAVVVPMLVLMVGLLVALDVGWIN